MGTIARLNTAKKKLAQAEQAMPGAYQNNYTDSINQKLVQLADASLTGSTGVDTDALNAAYQQYRANSVANAQNGAAAAAGTANALAGGYGADWAKTAANQAAGEQIAGVDNSLSSLRADALQNWKQKMSDTTSVLDDLLGQQSLERSEYDGSVSNAQNWRDYLSGRVDTARQENSDFWNNVWNVVKGVGNAVKTGYDAYQGYYQWDKEFELQKQQYADSLQRTQLSDQISAMEQAQAFKQAGFDDLAAQTLTKYGLDSHECIGQRQQLRQEHDPAAGRPGHGRGGRLRHRGRAAEQLEPCIPAGAAGTAAAVQDHGHRKHEKRWEQLGKQERRLHDQPAAADGKQIFRHEGHRAPVRLLQADPDQCGMDQGRHRHQGQYPERGGRNRSGKGGNHGQQAAGSDHQNAVERQRHGGRRGGGVGEHGQPERRQLQYGAARSTADGKQWL